MSHPRTYTYIALLRGINVGSHKKIMMEDLKALYEQMHFRSVATYIQSGNVIFNAEKESQDELTSLIETAIERKYGFFVPVIIRTREEMQQVQADNPFLSDSNTSREKLHVTFLDKIPEQGLLNAAARLDYSPDRYIVQGRDVFVYCPEGYGGTKIDNSFFENRLKVKATTRNWKTVLKLVEIALMKDQ